MATRPPLSTLDLAVHDRLRAAAPAVVQRAQEKSAALDRLAAASQPYTRETLGRLTQGVGAWNEYELATRNSHHPMTDFVLQKQSRDFAQSPVRLATGSMQEPRYVPGGLERQIMSGLRNRTESFPDLMRRMWLLWHTHGEFNVSFLSDPKLPLNLAFNLHSAVAVQPGANPLTGKRSARVQLDKQGLLVRWFDIELDSFGDETSALRRLWEPSGEWSKESSSPIRTMAPYYELFWSILLSDGATAQNMAVNNGLLWFYSDSIFGAGSSGTDWAPDLDEPLDGDGLQGILDGSDLLQRAMDFLGQAVPELTGSTMVGGVSDIERYVDATSRIWRDPKIALRRTPLPVAGEKKPEWVEVGRKFDTATQAKLAANEQAIARGLQVPARWALDYLPNAPAESSGGTLQRSSEYKASLRNGSNEIMQSFSDGVLHDVLRANGVTDPEQYFLHVDLSHTGASEDQVAVAAWAFERLGVKREWAAKTLGIPEDALLDGAELDQWKMDSSAQTTQGGAQAFAQGSASQMPNLGRMKATLALDPAGPYPDETVTWFERR